MGGTEVNPTPTSCTIAPKGRHPNAHPGAPVLGCSHQGSKAGGKMFRVNVPEAVGIVPTIIKQEGVQSMATPTSQVPIEGFKSFKDLLSVMACEKHFASLQLGLRKSYQLL